MGQFDGQHALVTGGGRGIGRAVAAALAAGGAQVTILGRTEETLKAAVAAGVARGYVTADVTQEKQVVDAVARASTARGPIGILIANAGGAESAPFLKGDPAIFLRMFETNVLSVVHAARAVLGGMVERRAGRIVAVASTAGLKGYPYVSAYTAAKHAVVGLVRSLALEVASSGVTVNAVCPGYTDTDLVRGSLDQISAKTGKSREASLAGLLDGEAGRLLTPEEVAAAVVRLCLPEAAAVTGAAVPVVAGAA